MFLYHYNEKDFDYILTRDLQGIVSKEERKKGLEASSYRYSKGPYYESESFLLEPAPLDIIDTIYPKDHHTWYKNHRLYEHAIDLRKLDIYAWEIMEGPVGALFNDHIPWIDNPFYKKMFFKSLSVSRKLFNESGTDIDGLLKALKRFPKGTTRKAYEDVINRGDYDDIKNKYAATVPHLMVYTKKPIPVFKSTYVVVGDSNARTPLSATW